MSPEPEPQTDLKEQPVESKPTITFQSKIYYLSGGHELIAHLEPPKIIAGGLIQFLKADEIDVVPIAVVKKVSTRVIQVEPTNGHSRIIV